MAVTYGFYNSVNGDRKYNAVQMAQIFDGIIEDGVFNSVGTAFAVTPSSGMVISVGAGRAWFNHTWTYNDAAITLTVGAAPVGSLKRIDAVVIEVDENNRSNSIKIVAGTESATPVKPTMVDSDGVHQHALAYISTEAGVTAITATMIASAVGTDTPFVTGPLETVGVTTLYNYWRAEFETWFDHLQDELDSNQAANLQHQIDDLDDKIDDAISSLNPAELWVWKKFNYTPASYHDGEIDINEIILLTTGEGASEKIYYSDSISVDEHGTVNLINPSTLYLSYNNYSNASVLKGKYIRREVLSQVAFIPTTATFSREISGRDYSVRASTLTYIDGVAAVVSNVEYVSSPNSSTYPEHGQSGDYWYTRLGQIGGAARIETGSYVGTGTYGADNPNSLTFGFAPKLFSIYGAMYISPNDYQIVSIYDGNYVNPIVPFDILDKYYRRCLAPGTPENNSASSYAKKSEDGKTITWYAGSAQSQLNMSGYSHFYFAIG